MKLKILALTAALPAIILMLNLTAYALTGAGFLMPAAAQTVHDARIVVAGLSAAIAVILFGASLEV